MPFKASDQAETRKATQKALAHPNENNAAPTMAEAEGPAHSGQAVETISMSAANPNEASDKPETCRETEDIATILLRSKDSKVAEAARRVFSRSTNPTYRLTIGTGSSVSRASEPSVPRHSLATDEQQIHTLSTSPGIVQKAHAVSVVPAHKSVAAILSAVSESSAQPASSLSVPDTMVGKQATPLSPVVSGGKKQNSSERLHRSRERNRMHARKTRQRKKEHMQNLQNRADELKNEQLRLKQVINEKNTANILLGMFSTADGKDSNESNSDIDPKVDELLKRAPEDIPDASKIPELPALILPGHHSGKKNKVVSSTAALEGADGSSAHATSSEPQHENTEDGIDYALLGKDRSTCTPAELDQIRRERNRMHAKRTRDRKRIFMEEMEEIIKQLESENEKLVDHIDSLNARLGPTSTGTVASIVSPTIAPTATRDPSPICIAPSLPAAAESAPNPAGGANSESMKSRKTIPKDSTMAKKKVGGDSLVLKNVGDNSLDHIKSLLDAAGTFDQQSSRARLTISSTASAVSASTTHSAHASISGDDDPPQLSNASSPRPTKRQCVDRPPPEHDGLASAVPSSITTGTAAC